MKSFCRCDRQIQGNFRGFDVRFQTGTDEHGQKIELKAEKKQALHQKEFVDNVSTEIHRIWDLMNTLL